MKLPAMRFKDGIRKGKQVKFGGLNHNLGASDGELWDMKNLTGEHYPLLASRNSRVKVNTLTSPGGLFAHNGLAWVDGTGFYYKGERKGAVTAGTQAGDYYATKLNDMLPTLRANAYDEYLNEYQQLANDLSALNNQEQLEYQKYLNELNQYNTNRSFAYNDYQTQYNMLQNALSNLQGQQQNEYNQAYQTQQYIDALEQYREQQKQQEIENAMNAAQIFGYVPENFAGTLGIDAGTRTADQAYREYQMAQQAAKAVAGTGNGSSGSSKSGGSSGNESKMTLTTAKQAASNGAFNDQVLSVLRENGYTDDMLEAIYGYTPTTAAGTQEESGMNDAYFTAAMRSVSGALSSGNVSGAQSAIDQIWDRLSPAQQASVSKLIQSYGGTMQ